MRAGFAEQEMQLSELEMSAGDGDAARGLVPMEGEPVGPVQHSCAKSLPLQAQGLHEE